MAKDGLNPLISEKNRSDYLVHGIQIDLLVLTVSMQKSGLKICTESQDITKKVYKIGLSNQTKPSGLDA